MKPTTYHTITNPRVLYICLVTACIVILTLSFTSWNKQNLFVESYKIASIHNLKYSIDACGTNKSTIFIKGWLFNESYPDEGSLIVTATLNNKEVIIPSFTFARNDVAQAFSRTKAFDNLGFNASISQHLIGHSKNITFIFYVKNNNNISKVLSHECK